MSKMNQLAELGQSVWIDFIQRSFTESGKLGDLVAQGLRGVTSNPTIFEKAINGSSDYDEAIRKLVGQDKDVIQIYEALVLEDIGRAADVFESVYRSSDGLDGYVSIEVNPKLAHETAETLAEAKRLFSDLNRPNVMIKIPATPAGIPAVRELIAEGINVNVTLIFGLDHYLDSVNAYLDGLEQLAGRGGNLTGVASVASFFVSRLDSAVDPLLQEAGHGELAGKIAIANAKSAYREFQNIINSARWKSLEKQGARKQRLLWASTSTKNKAYSDLLYIDNLIGPHTVNTIPPDTLEHFLNHGRTEVTITKGVQEAAVQLAALTDAGIDLRKVTEKLQVDGVDAFEASFDKLNRAIEVKREVVTT